MKAKGVSKRLTRSTGGTPSKQKSEAAKKAATKVPATPQRTSKRNLSTNEQQAKVLKDAQVALSIRQTRAKVLKGGQNENHKKLVELLELGQPGIAVPV